MRGFSSFLALCAYPFLASAQPAQVDFARDILPVLTSRCRVCHTGDSAQAKLNIHTRADLLKGGVSGPAIVPGDSAASLLIRRVEGKAGPRMPPTGAPLDPEVIRALKTWIDTGAKWDAVAPTATPLARVAPRQVSIPPTRQHPIDFLLARYYQRHNVTPGAPVSDAVYARRVYYDLWGVPPTPEQLAAFLDDPAPDKRARLIDTLLDSRALYAGHWISFWNDLLRNDEGVIYHGERKSITAWLHRALETNLPYNRMVSALLHPVSKDDPDGYLIGMTWRGTVSASQTPPMQAAQNAAQVFLGINIKCAACHDSFVNRWKLADTYGLASFFSDEKLELVRCDIPQGVHAEARFPYEGVPGIAWDSTLASRRAAAARWFTAPENGRFARTIVNRYWRVLFGRGIVEPADDMDAAPFDADLLDWLASDFAAHGYDLQHLLRRIMTSRAYQLPAVPDGGPFRGPRLRRLTAEQFSDTLSAVTGEWRVRAPRTELTASWAREWQLKSDPLSRALGRPIRDQVYTERSDAATTFQALELTNGPLLAHRLERGALKLLGKLKMPPANLFDSRLMRSGAAQVDVDITGARELWLLIEDVDSYDPARVIAGWSGAELSGPNGTEALNAAPFNVKPIQKFDIAGKGFTRFRATAFIDEKSRLSDISPALRFFVFTEEPDRERLVRIAGSTPLPEPSSPPTAERLYRHLLSRAPTPRELAIANEILSAGQSGLEDLLWSILMSPECQYIQ